MLCDVCRKSIGVGLAALLCSLPQGIRFCRLASGFAARHPFMPHGIRFCRMASGFECLLVLTTSGHQMVWGLSVWFFGLAFCSFRQQAVSPVAFDAGRHSYAERRHN